METRARYMLVGIMVIALFSVAFAFAWWRASGSGETMVPLTVSIPGSVSGLARGSSVRFNGIPIGTVTALDFDPNDPARVIATAEVRADAPITASTGATLGFGGLTGSTTIDLIAGPNASISEPRFAQIYEMDESENPAIPNIDADASVVSSLLDRAENIANTTDALLEEVRTLLGEVRDPTTASFSNIETFTAALADNSENIDDLLASVGRLAETLDTAAVRVDRTLNTVDGIVASVDGEAVGAIVDNIAAVSGELPAIAQDVRGVTSTLNETTQRAALAIDNIVTSVDQIAGLTSGLGEGAFSTIIDDVSTSTSAVRGILEGIEPGSVQTIVDEAGQTLAAVRETEIGRAHV